MKAPRRPQAPPRASEASHSVSRGDPQAGQFPVECGVIRCREEFATVDALREHAKSSHTDPAHSVHRSSPAARYCQDRVWPPGVERTVPSGLRRLAELEWIDEEKEQVVQAHLANHENGFYTIPLNKIAPHSSHLSEYFDAHSEVLVTIGNAPSPPHIDFYTEDENPPTDFTPVSGNQMLLAGIKLWTHVPSEFLGRGFKWIGDQLDLATPVARSWPSAEVHPGDETTAAGGEIHAVMQLTEITFSLGSAFRFLDNTTIPQDRHWFKEEDRVVVA